MGLTLLLAVFCAPVWALSVERPTLHQFDDGPPLPPSHLYLPGETVFFTCRLGGFKTSMAADEQRSVKVSWQWEILDPSGAPLVKPGSGKLADVVAPQDKDWMPKVVFNFNVPPYAPGGNYQIRFIARDEVAQEERKAEFMFPVRGHEVEPSDSLVARNLHFLRSEADGPALNPAVFRPGETLWARFDIAGYKYGDKNRFHVEYGLAVLAEDGKQVFAQPAAAEDSSESFYPQRYVPGALSLNLNQGVPAGTYTLVITLEDKVGGQTGETRGEFRVER